MLEDKIYQLEAEVEKIKERNKRVESDKAWETSKTRTAFIAITTYLLIFFFMVLLKEKEPFLNAFVATVVYLISTSSYGILKAWWVKKRNT